MRVVLGLGILALAGCASSPHPESARPASESVRVVGETGLNIRMAGSDGAATGTVAFPVDKVWNVLGSVYDSLGIPIGTLDPTRHLIGNTGFTAYQRLGKTSLAKFIDCGRTQGFPSADSYDIYLQITTQVQPKDSGSMLSTLLEAAGRPMVVKGDYIKCSSLGTLEAAIIAGVRDRLNKG